MREMSFKGITWNHFLQVSFYPAKESGSINFIILQITKVQIKYHLFRMYKFKSSKFLNIKKN